jgi:hypothetical protein
MDIGVIHWPFGGRFRRLPLPRAAPGPSPGREQIAEWQILAEIERYENLR